MLNTEEELRIRDALGKVEASVSQVVRHATDAWQAIAFVKTLHANVDAVVRAQTFDDLKPECKPGCSFCCSAKVEVSDPEALHIAAAMRSMPEARGQWLTAALRSQLANRSNTTAHTRVPCGFLQDDLCSIYEYRPAVCRRAHSLSAKACEMNSPSLPMILNLSLGCEVLITGTHRAYEGLRLPAGRHELSAAVLAALETDKAAEHWFEGVPLLAPPTGTI